MHIYYFSNTPYFLKQYPTSTEVEIRQCTIETTYIENLDFTVRYAYYLADKNTTITDVSLETFNGYTLVDPSTVRKTLDDESDIINTNETTEPDPAMDYLIYLFKMKLLEDKPKMIFRPATKVTTSDGQIHYVIPPLPAYITREPPEATLP